MAFLVEKLKRCMDAPEYADRLFVPFVYRPTSCGTPRKPSFLTPPRAPLLHALVWPSPWDLMVSRSTSSLSNPTHPEDRVTLYRRNPGCTLDQCFEGRARIGRCWLKSPGTLPWFSGERVREPAPRVFFVLQKVDRFLRPEPHRQTTESRPWRESR
jgi:hypothetical protein